VAWPGRHTPGIDRTSGVSPAVKLFAQSADAQAMTRDLPTAAERIAEAFNECFANFEIRIEAGDVVLGTRRQIHEQGWRVAYRVVPDDGGFPSLEFYATHRMTSDRHARIWADGHIQGLDAIHEFYAYDPEVPGSREAAEEKYLRHNRLVADQLRASGLYPEGDVNAFLRTGGDQPDGDDGPHDATRGGG
jgi:hypothetical protein